MIKVLENAPVQYVHKTPAELAQGRNIVVVDLPKAITIELEGHIVVSYPEGLSDAPTEVANALVAQGARLFGYENLALTSKPADGRIQPGPRRVGGAIRFPKFGEKFD